MKVILADELGFCFGVKRSYEMALSNAKDAAIIGQLVHNSDVQDKLYDSGIKDYADGLNVKKLILRSHGTIKSEKEILERKYKLIDTTCPVLLNIYKQIQKYEKDGYINIILGSKIHPEVIATASQVNKCIIIEDEEDINNLDINEKYFVTMQTTLNDELAERLVNYILKKFENNSENIVIKNTICSASKKRRAALIELTKITDCIIILGGENSNNTKELANILKEKKFPYYLTKSVFSLDLSSIKKYNRVGISAGASTPDWIIEETVRVLNDIDRNIEGEKINSIP